MFHLVLVSFLREYSQNPHLKNHKTLLANITAKAESLLHILKQAAGSIGFYHIYPTPPLGQDMTQGQFLSEV